MTEDASLYKPRFTPCSFCGGDEFVWGAVDQRHHTSTDFKFYPDPKGMLQKVFGAPQAFRLSARLCRQCGHLEWFSRKMPIDLE